MSDLSDPYAGQDPNEPPNVRQMREHIKKLEGEAREAGEAKARAAELERQLALRDAGLELDPLQLKALGAVHDGDWTADSIRDTAAKLGFAAPAPPPSAVPPQELAALSRMTAATAGAPTAAPPMDRLQERNARLLQAKSDAEFTAIYNEYGPIGT